MRILKSIVTTCAVLSLAACTSASSVNVGTDITSFENGVIADVEAGCQVEPTLASIAALFPVYGGAIAAAANDVCAAVNAVPAPASLAATMTTSGAVIRHGFPTVVVRGHKVHFN